MKAWLLFFIALGACAQVPVLSFTKEFPGSRPAYASVTVSKDGAMEYKEAVKDDRPVRAALPASESAALFDLAQKLDFFHAEIESGLKVANTGKKTFRYDDGSGKPSQVVFNYSTNPVAQQLLNKFEQISETERAYVDLERSVKFDKLGVNDSLAQVESLWLRKELAAPLQFVPLLNRIALHESYMHLARERAARLRDQFQTASVQPAPAAPETK